MTQRKNRLTQGRRRSEPEKKEANPGKKADLGEKRA
jgi:hypothetical protein